MLSRIGALCSIPLSLALALGLSGTAAAENADIRMVEQEIIITVEGDVYEVGVDVESVEEFIEENKPDGVSTMAWREDYFTYGTLRTQTASCAYASIDYFKTGGSTIRVDFGVAQVGRATKWANRWRSISSGGRSGHTFSIASSGNVQGRMNVDGQGEFVNKYISCR